MRMMLKINENPSNYLMNIAAQGVRDKEEMFLQDIL